MNDKLQQILQDDVSIEELQKLSADAGRMSYEENVDYRTDILKAQLVYAVMQEMKVQKISQAALAKRMQTSRQYVCRILHETANFTLKTIAELAVALDLEASVSFSRIAVTHDHVLEEKKSAQKRRSLGKHKMRRSVGALG